MLKLYGILKRREKDDKLISSLIASKRNYLTYPRLHFYGQFRTKPSTVNNDDYFGGGDTSQSTFASAGSEDWDTFAKDREKYMQWNPYGDASWNFSNCKITGAYDENNARVNDDTIIGLSINRNVNKNAGKLVDVDSEAQIRSQIWGFNVNINNKDASLTDILQSQFEPSAFQYITTTRPGPGIGGMAAMGAFYQSILNNVTNNGNLINSPVLNEIFANTNNNQLSIRFYVDGYNPSAQDNNFCMGTVSGTISPYYENSPYSFDYCRFLNTTPSNSAIPPSVMNINVKNNQLLVDYSNVMYKSNSLYSYDAVSNNEAGNYWTYNDIGDIVVYVYNKDHPEYETKYQWTLSSSEYYNADNITSFVDFSQNNACIKSFALNNDEINIVNSNSLRCKTVYNGTSTIVAKEDDNGLYVQADKLFARLDADEETSINIIPMKYGKSVSSGTINIPQAVVNSNYYKATSNAILSLNDGTSSIIDLKSNNQKYGVVNIKAPSTIRSDPNDIKTQPRYAYNLDSLVYETGYSYQDANGNTYQVAAQTSAQGISTYPTIITLVHDKYTIPQTPTWVDDVFPILNFYNNMYPVMHSILNLSNYSSVTAHIDSMKRAFMTPINNAAYMPVTRDLSNAKREMILKWLNFPIYSKHFVPFDFTPVVNKDDLMGLLQNAIALEHSTIPVYLSALYSIKPSQLLTSNNANAFSLNAIYNVLKSIVIEEMKHLCLISNLLNAIGGQVNLLNVNNMPSYPTKLPANVQPELTVSLGPLTRDRLLNTYMPIELPSETILSTIKGVKKQLEHLEQFQLKAKNINMQANANINNKLNQLIISYPNLKKVKEAAKTGYSNTIGEYYYMIKESLYQINKKDGSNLFTGDIRKQVTSQEMKGMFAVYNIDTAMQAINAIVEEGEGSSLSDIYNGEGNLSHFHKFLEMYLGKQIFGVQEVTVEKIERQINLKNLHDKNAANITNINDLHLLTTINNIYDNKNVFKQLNLNVNDRNDVRHFQYIFGQDFPWDENTDCYVDTSLWTKGETLTSEQVMQFNQQYANLLICLNNVFNGQKDQITQAIPIMKQMQIMFQQCIDPQPIIASPTSSPTLPFDTPDRKSVV